SSTRPVPGSPPVAASCCTGRRGSASPPSCRASPRMPTPPWVFPPTPPEPKPHFRISLWSTCSPARSPSTPPRFPPPSPRRPAAPPIPLGAALDGALLRSALPDNAHDQLAVRLAVLELVRALAADRPVWLVLDDVQWVDQPSAGVLRFVARRLEGVGARVLAAERVPDGGAPTALDLCPPP